MDSIQVRMVYGQGTGGDGVWTGHMWGWCMDSTRVRVVYGQYTGEDGVRTGHS